MQILVILEMVCVVVTISIQQLMENVLKVRISFMHARNCVCKEVIFKSKFFFINKKGWLFDQYIDGEDPANYISKYGLKELEM